MFSAAPADKRALLDLSSVTGTVDDLVGSVESDLGLNLPDISSTLTSLDTEVKNILSAAETYVDVDGTLDSVKSTLLTTNSEVNSVLSTLGLSGATAGATADLTNVISEAQGLLTDLESLSATSITSGLVSELTALVQELLGSLSSVSTGL